MGKKGKKKKSKEEIEAERIAREEEERIAAELEKKRLEEERIAAEKAHLARQQELSKLRSEELIRLRAEQDDSQQGLAQFTRRLTEVEAQSQANMEWKRYVNCSRMPNPLSETELNTFVSEWTTDGVLELEETLSTCIETETVASDITSYASTSRGRGDMKQAEKFDQYANKLRDAQLKKVDYATSSLLTNASQYTNEKNECKISSNAGSLKFGLWVNVALKPFRLKVVDFGKTGIIVDIPKPLALHSVAVRVLYHPSNHVSGGVVSGDEVAVGGVLHMDLLQMPPLNAKRQRLDDASSDKFIVGRWTHIVPTRKQRQCLQFERPTPAREMCRSVKRGGTVGFENGVVECCCWFMGRGRCHRCNF